MKKYFLTLLSCALLSTSSFSQDIELEFTTAENRITSQNQNVKNRENSWLKNVPIKSIGPP